MENLKVYHGVKSLSDMYAKKHNTTLKVAEERVKEMKDLLEEGLLDPNYDGIRFVDFITLKKVTRKSKIGRNPRTKVEVVIPARPGVKTEISERIEKSMRDMWEV